MANDMDVYVYVETNFLMSVAMGRESQGDSLLDAVSESVHIAIPTGCFMEAFSALEDEQKSRGAFRAALERQISQLARDATSQHAQELLQLLQESLIANDSLSNDVQTRLFELANRMAEVCTPITEEAEVIRRSLTDIYIEGDPTDNLILHAILEHARKSDAHKAFLTENKNDFGKPPVRAALQAAGIVLLHKVENALGWLESVGG